MLVDCVPFLNNKLLKMKNISIFFDFILTILACFINALLFYCREIRKQMQFSRCFLCSEFSVKASTTVIC